MTDRHDRIERELRNVAARDQLLGTTRRAFLGRLGTAGIGALGLGFCTAIALSRAGMSAVIALMPTRGSDTLTSS